MAMEPQFCFIGTPALIVSPVMRELMTEVERIARVSATVLVVGETGSGKEIVARALHHYSLRANKPWVDVNCGALPEQLMESELFGHEKGAFSGADAAKPGLFELARTGTLFLDEVGELDLRMQIKLLRVLDGTPYYRLGGQKKIVVDTRVVAATNQNLDEAVDAKRFRSDLFHRLNELQIEVPPLRRRPEDIIALAHYFIHQHDPQARISSRAQEMLLRHGWPGNIRELRNVATRALIRAKGGEIDSPDLGLQESGPNRISRRGDQFRLHDTEREMIMEALRETGGRRQRAADLLGISRRTLTRKLTVYRTKPLEELPHEYDQATIQ